MPNSVWTVSGESLVLTSSTTPISTESSGENVNYLTNGDIIALMAQYAAELATKTQLDETAASLSVSSTYYDNAVAAISTGLIAAGSPSNWATIWPNGQTYGPWTGIQTSLANWWAQVATQRTALQSYISYAQAAVAEAAAISTAVATAATNAANTYAASIAAPLVVSSLPTLPSNSYPSGKLVLLTTTGVLYESTGSAWTAVTVAGSSITEGSITAGQIAAGAIGATQIAAGSITASALTVVDMTNLCKNPTWGDGLNSCWTYDISAGQEVVTWGRTTDALLVFSGSPTYAIRNTNYVPVTAGQTYYAEAWIALAAGITSGGVCVRLVGHNSSGAEVWNTALGNTVSTANAGFLLSCVSGVVPSGVATLHMELVSLGLVGAGLFALISDCFLRRQSDASMIVDGAITANQISTGYVYTGAITADQITTGTLNAADVTVTNLNASNITTGTLSATQVIFPDGTSLDTASRVTNSKASLSSPVTAGTGVTEILSWTVTTSYATDAYNIQGLLMCSAMSSFAGANIIICVNGSTATNYGLGYIPDTIITPFPFVGSITGLSPGTNTIQVYVQNTLGGTVTVSAAQAICQRIY